MSSEIRCEACPSAGTDVSFGQPRPPAKDRGYGAEHRRERARWVPIVEAGGVLCAEAICLVERDGGSRLIYPGDRWHLAHTVDRTGYLGPAHKRCNESEGARRGNAITNGTAAPKTSGLTLWWRP